MLNKRRDYFQTLFTSDSANTKPFNFYDNLYVTSLNEKITRDEVKLAVYFTENKKAAGIEDLPVLKNDVAIDLYRISG